MGAVPLIVRHGLRRRWQSVLVLTLLVGIGGGATLAAVAGARRTTTAFNRFVAEDRSADALVNASSLGPELLDDVERLPQVAALARLAVFFLLPTQPVSSPMVFVANVDGRLGTVLDRGRLVAGRRPDPDAVHEVILGEAAASTHQLRVGSRIRLRALVPAARGPAGEPEYEPGPRVALRVVGISRGPADLAASGLPQATVILTPAFFRHYRDRLGYYDGLARVRLRGGAAAVPAFLDRVGDIYDDPALSFEPLAAETSGVSDTIDVLALALVVFAFAAGIAALVAVGLALSRQADLASADHPILRALGVTPVQRVLIAFGPAAVVAIGGALVAVGVAVVASPLMPMGLARRADPDRGFSVDASVLALGAGAIVAVVGALGLFGAWRALRLWDRDPSRIEPGKTTGSSASRALTRAGAGPAAVIGVRLALEPGRGRSAVAVRPALTGAAVGVAGIVAVLTLGASLASLLDTPRLYGWTWDGAAPGLGPKALRRDADLTTVTKAVLVNVAVDGRPVEGMGFSPLKGLRSARFPAIVEGRAPRAANEVALGTETLKQLPAEPTFGDAVEISGAAGRGRYRVVGRVVLPSIGRDRIPVADGAVFTGAGIERLTSNEDPDRYERFLVTFAAGREEEVTARLFPNAVDLRRTEEPGALPQPPPEVRKLEEVKRLPQVLAAFLALLAMVAIGHAIVTTVQRRRRDLSILKTLGFTGRQLAATIAWQASTPVVVGLVIGVPLGIIAGRWIWTQIADGLGVALDNSVPVLALALMVPIALLVANLVAALPGRAAARTKPAIVLRSE